MTTEIFFEPTPTRATEPIILKIKRKPDVQFWKQLRDFLFHGCHTDAEVKISNFCKSYDVDFTDLSNYQFPESKDFQDMDRQLLKHLLKTANIDKNLNLGNFFKFILYQIINHYKLL